MSFSKNPVAASVVAILVSAATFAGGDFFYPPAGRTEPQQRQDRFECHEWAVAQSKFDPVEFASRVNLSAPTPTPKQETDAGHSAGRSMVGGAATGALVGEAVNNDAGQGAITGGAVGLLRGKMTEKKVSQARAQQQQAAATQDVRTKQQDYSRARSTCFKARGWTVSEG